MFKHAGDIICATFLAVSSRTQIQCPKSMSPPDLCDSFTSLRREVYVPLSQWTATSSQQEEMHDIL